MEKTNDSARDPSPNEDVSITTRKPKIRNRLFSIRLTPEEWAFMEEKVHASGLGRTDYVLHVLQERPVTKKETIGKIVQLLRERADILDYFFRTCDESDFEKTRLISLARNRAVQTYMGLIDIEVKGGKDNGEK